MWSLAYKCVFYRPENNAKEGTQRKWILKMQKWNIPTKRAQRVDGKMGHLSS